MSPTQRLDLIKILVGIYCFFTAMGMNLVVFPVILKTNNITETLIGLSVVIELLAGICFASKIVQLLKTHGAKAFLKVATAIYFAVMMLIGSYINFIIWLGFILLIGVYWYGFSMIKQSWYNMIIPNKGRNLMISINTIILSFGFATGSYIVSVMGSLNPYNMMVAFLFAFISVISISLIKTPMPEVQDNISHDVTKFFKRRPFLYFAKFTQEIISISILSFIVIYAINIGFTSEQGAILAGLFTISAILNLVSASFLDRFHYKFIFLFVAICLVGALSGLYYYRDDFMILSILCFISGFLVSFYYIGCEAEVNYYFNNEERLGANNALSFVTNLGGICGCLLTGCLIYRVGAMGFVLPSIIGQVVIILILVFCKIGLMSARKVRA